MATPSKRRAPGAHPANERTGEHAGIALGLVDLLAGLSRPALAGRLSSRRSLSGRTWIALVAFALIGIVTMQLGLLKLNAGIGRALEHQALLQRENAALSIENSEMTAGNRIESRAARVGMTLVPSGALRFLTPRGRIDATRAAASLGHAQSSTGGSAPAAAESSSSSRAAEGAQVTSGAEATTSSGTGAEAATSSRNSGEASGGGSGSTSASTSPSGAEARGPSSAGARSEASSSEAPSASAQSHGEASGAESAKPSQPASASGGAGEAVSARAATGGGEAAPPGH